MGSYFLKKTVAGQFHFNLRASNNEVILTSESYTSKQSATAGIESVRTNSALDSRYEKRTSTPKAPSLGSPYFVLKAANGEVIGTSEMYSSEQARDRGIAACKKEGPSSPTSDQT